MIAVIAVLGACATAIVLIRLLVAIRRREGRDAVLGWFGMMVAIPLVVFAIDRVARAL